MCRWLELLLLCLVVALALMPALGRCDVAPQEPSCPQGRAMEDFAYLLAEQEAPIECAANDTVRP